MPTPPSADDVLGYMQKLSNWGRWGKDDELGTLNYITPAVRKAAAALVKDGITVSCSWEIDTTPQPDSGNIAPIRLMTGSGQGLYDPDPALAPGQRAPGRMAGAGDFLGISYHGYSTTHLDALGHIFWDKKAYNGVPAEKISTRLGATRHSITTVAEGIVTRGVLLDVAAARGVDWMKTGEGVFPEDLEAAEKRQKVQVRPGDALLLRTGYGRKKREQGREPLPSSGLPGYHAASMPWIHERQVAVLGADVPNDVHPSGYEAAGMNLPVHIVGIVAMGLRLIDNMQLEDLAATCQRLNRWEFQFVLLPLRWPGATGSPANPVAVL